MGSLKALRFRDTVIDNRPLEAYVLVELAAEKRPLEYQGQSSAVLANTVLHLLCEPPTTGKTLTERQHDTIWERQGCA
jgi:hypothetical protein